MGLDKVYILDFGSQYAHLISRRIRELHIYSEIVSPDTPLKMLLDAKGIILSGGPHNLSEDDSLKCDPKIFSSGIPVLGICYGHQLMAYVLGGTISRGNTKEYGLAALNLIKLNSPLFSGIKTEEKVWMSHGDYVEKIPVGFTVCASTDDVTVSAMEDTKRNLYGIQFHPEVTHTECGMKILYNFAVNICGIVQSWTMNAYVDKITKEIIRKSAGKNVFLLVSGGVDSTVCFALLNNALGKERVFGLHIDNGFMRKNESNNIKRDLLKMGFDNIDICDARDTFIDAIKGVTEPEKKRNIIGNTFIAVQQDELKKSGLNPDNWILAQGTIYPDTIESSGTKHADLIKTHHNRVPLIEEMIRQGKVIEPLVYLYKDEVRELGKELMLPDSAIERHPFPGPGLAIRCLCSTGNEIICNKDIAIEKINNITRKYNLICGILPIKSVGVQGDERTYRNPAFITGNCDFKTLETISTEITNNVIEINRVLLLLNSNTIPKLKAKEAYLTKNRIELLREIDNIVNETTKAAGIASEIWQFPVVLIPIGDNYFESVVLRPITSKEAMTARFYYMEKIILDDIIEKILKLNIDFIFYDITNKPPATIEWE
ncbi:MAG: glutamine-hydrolyzing GMP synthase [archaeon]